MKYSDIIQISEEILTTLRVCSTLLEDLQRRYDILESLQNHIESDLEHPEWEKIEIAIKEGFKDNFKYGKENDELYKKLISLIMQPVTAAGDLLSIPTLQIQGQMQRTDRLMLFLATAKMFKQGWNEWQEKIKDIIEPNLRIMFELKRDFFKNQMICICDTITYNGYKLDNLSSFMEKKFIKN